jgi:hypothetical protein
MKVINKQIQDEFFREFINYSKKLKLQRENNFGHKMNDLMF